MALSSYTLVALARRLARELGAIKAEGTASAASGTLVTDAVNLLFPATNDAAGYQLVLISGGGTGNEGVTRFITSSVANTSVTVPSVTGLNGTTPVYMVLDPRIANYQQLVDAIRAAIETVVHLYLPVKMNATLRTNDLMMGLGDMEVWTNGAAVASDGWALSGGTATVAQASTVAIVNAPHDGADFGVQYAAGITNQVSVDAYYAWYPDFTKYAGFGGKAFKMVAQILASSATRARIYVSDGVTSTLSSYHTGSGNFEELTSEATMANPITQLAAVVKTDSGAAITIRADTARLLSQSVSLYDYTLPASYTSLAEVWIGGEDEYEFQFSRRVPDHLWDVFKGTSNDRLRFRPGISLPEDCRILLIGQSDITIPSAATDNIDANPEYVITFAKSQISYRNGKVAEGDRWYGMARQDREEMSPHLLSNSKIIERL